MKRLILIFGLVFGLMLCAGSAHAQGIVVHSESWICSAACTSHTLGTAASAGDLVILFCSDQSAGHCAGAVHASTPSYTWQNPDTGGGMSVAYICPGTNTSGLTAVTFDTSGGAMIFEMEFGSIAGTTGTTCVDSENIGTSNTGSTWTTGNVTTTNALDCLVITTMSNVNAAGYSINAPFSLILTAQDSTNTGAALSGYENVSSTGTYHATGNMPTGNSQGYADIIAFKANSSPPPSSCTPTLTLLGVSGKCG